MTGADHLILTFSILVKKFMCSVLENQTDNHLIRLRLTSISSTTQDSERSIS